MSEEQKDIDIIYQHDIDIMYEVSGKDDKEGENE